MKFTDIFIRRPVFAIVISLLLLVFGVRALTDLQVRQYPEMEIGQLNITTVYPGANAELVQGFVTTPIQESISSVEGIDYMKASSRAGVSMIEVVLNLGYDVNTAMAEMLSKINEVQGRLPVDISDPVISKASAGNDAIMYIAYQSTSMSEPQITDYLRRVVQPKLTEIPGLSRAALFGGKEYAMRIHLDPVRMRALNVTSAQVNNALVSNNFQSAAGELRNSYTVTSIRASTSLQDHEAFSDITVHSDGQRVVKLGDIARVELATDTEREIVSYDSKPAVYIGIQTTPSANPLDVAAGVREMLPEIETDLPSGLFQYLAYDTTMFIEESISEVLTTLLEATVIVVLVVFLFLGSPRSVLVPIVTIPLSLVGVALFMLMMGYSINLLTLLAMVMAISLVVDDAIVVVENVYRHIEEGVQPMRAAVIGAREIAMPIIAMTITLAAVYAPIGFMGGLTGTLFSEFAFTLAGAVLISGIIALTLSPLMSGSLLNKKSLEGRFVRFINSLFDKLKVGYSSLLDRALSDYRPGIVISAFILLAAIGAMFTMTQSELAPVEDQGFILTMGIAPDNANVQYVQTYAEQVEEILATYPEYDQTFVISGMPVENNVMAGMVLTPWSQRERSQMDLQPQLQGELMSVAGMEVYAINPPSLPGTPMGMPVSFVITTTQDYNALFDIADELKNKAMQSGLFMIANNTLRMNKPQVHVLIDRAKAGQLGISMSDIGSVLATQLGDFRTNYFDIQGRSYEVVPQADTQFQKTSEAIDNLYVSTQSGKQVPLSTIVEISREVVPNDLTQFQQLNSAVIEAMPMPGVATLADAHEFLSKTLEEIAPQGFMHDYAGQSRQFEQEGTALMMTFVLALIVIYLVLSAQFESFRDPFVVLITVPLSIFGAMIPLFFGMATMNIYTQVGLITLIGLISKHGILIVEFSNQLQKQGKDRIAAVKEAAALRLRPILMTTAAMVLGVMPLVMASGAGAVSRNNIGLVITVGLSIGTLFTLFVVPVMYSLLAKPFDQEVEMERISLTE
ncbi:multidrug efflux protein [Solemya velum gill symbiont]|uniref:Multidrug efflux protein n=3 Tax=Solemya velum gill symbiont TaxID=2340 RepID=A0A1T2CQP3_SOVGS|nr:efflux RND transporter permease subunit [Solemya velum gill symbiont]OOY34281.1 multidrug efflux protein [Solemya velum gill symbiont]OOY37054.1 multidrug efflux protein [Solemya velum gill symbiont]OOY40271.1 multidrug efflux protein [Solemya velum gill symbiont]OOY44762.1 multidrug efflux protein [Solemya velum gill symbiont]OOY47376.1 multidrug efflux protein [Solemya velum gill symbiont]